MLHRPEHAGARTARSRSRALAISDDGKYIAYGVAEAGCDWNTWKVLDVATGKPLDDELKWVKFSGASWTKDNKGFYLQPLPRAEEGRRRSRL